MSDTTDSKFDIDIARKKFGPRAALIESIIEGLAPVIKEYTERKLANVLRRIDALEKAQNDFTYTGVFNSARNYRRGNFVTFNGGLWHCEVDSSGAARPGDGNVWKLAVKSPGR